MADQDQEEYHYDEQDEQYGQDHQHYQGSEPTMHDIINSVFTDLVDDLVDGFEINYDTHVSMLRISAKDYVLFFNYQGEEFLSASSTTPRLRSMSRLCSALSRCTDIESAHEYLIKEFAGIVVTGSALTKTDSTLLVDNTTDVMLFLEALNSTKIWGKKRYTQIHRLFLIASYFFSEKNNHCLVCYRSIKISGEVAIPSCCGTETCRQSILSPVFMNPHKYLPHAIGFIKLMHKYVLATLADTEKERVDISIPIKITTEELTLLTPFLAELVFVKTSNKMREWAEKVNPEDPIRQIYLIWILLNIIGKPMRLLSSSETREFIPKSILKIENILVVELARLHPIWLEGYPAPITVWHGTPASRVIAISRDGLTTLSGSKHMAFGAIYGPGIYTARDINVSAGNYGVGGAVFKLSLIPIPDKSQVLYVPGAEYYIIQNDKLQHITHIIFGT